MYDIMKLENIHKVQSINGNYTIKAKVVHHAVWLTYELIPAPTHCEFRLNVSTRYSVPAEYDDVDISYAACKGKIKDFWLQLVSISQDNTENARELTLDTVRSLLK